MQDILLLMKLRKDFFYSKYALIKKRKKDKILCQCICSGFLIIIHFIKFDGDLYTFLKNEETIFNGGSVVAAIFACKFLRWARIQCTGKSPRHHNRIVVDLCHWNRIQGSGMGVCKKNISLKNTFGNPSELLIELPVVIGILNNGLEWSPFQP